jgi:hypothetical protein
VIERREFSTAGSQDAERGEMLQDAAVFVSFSFFFFLSSRRNEPFQGVAASQDVENIFVWLSPVKYAPIRGSRTLRFGSFAAMA